MANSRYKNILIIRSEPGASKTAAKILDLGYSPIILPAAVLSATNNPINIESIQAFLITSSNAPRLANLTKECFEIPVYAVGDATQKAAIDRGFKEVISAGGDASTLAMLVADRLKAKNGALVHLRGNEVAGDVKGLLEACGFEVKTEIIYETIENPEFELNINNILKNNQGAVLFHSPKGAQRFAKFADKSLLKNWEALAISNGVSDKINNLFENIKISTSPNENSILKLLE